MTCFGHDWQPKSCSIRCRATSVLLVLLSSFVTTSQAFCLPTPSSNQPTTLTSHHSNNFQRYRRNPTVLYSTTAERKAEKVYTIQILMSDTGGGHRASANALRDALDELYPGKIECDIVDIYMEYGPFWPFNASVPMYKIMAQYSFLWRAFYEFGCTAFGLWLNVFLLEIFCFAPFKECMARHIGSTNARADMVVSVHPLTQDLPLKILTELDTNGKSRSKGKTTPFATVVTDLGGAHPTWFNPGVDKCFVPSDALYKCARDRSVAPGQIIQHGLPIRMGFWADRTATSEGADIGFDSTVEQNVDNTHSDGPMTNARNILGLIQGIPTVLVVGGGDGMGGIVDQVLALRTKLNADANGSTEPKYQIVVVCGNNAKAQQTLSAQKWGPGVSVHVKGFVNNMDEWMRASDALVTKAGPGTIAEATICGLPCMLSSFLPGQEEGNIQFVEQGGFGKFSADPRTIAETVSSWLSSPDMLETMKKNALAAARPSATIDIARDLAKMVFATSE